MRDCCGVLMSSVPCGTLHAINVYSWPQQVRFGPFPFLASPPHNGQLGRCCIHASLPNGISRLVTDVHSRHSNAGRSELTYDRLILHAVTILLWRTTSLLCGISRLTHQQTAAPAFQCCPTANYFPRHLLWVNRGCYVGVPLWKLVVTSVWMCESAIYMMHSLTLRSTADRKPL